jgi:broad specificity phosphatase PhoE
MKEVYLIRHAEKDPDGILTAQGEEAARALRDIIPAFAMVLSSGSSRTIRTAELLTGKKPVVDGRAGFSMSTQQKSDDINLIARQNNITFLEAAIKYNDSEVLAGVEAKAKELNELTSELLSNLEDDQKALIVSHDLSISPAVALDGVPLASIDFLSGYVIVSGKTPRPIDLQRDFV